MEFTERRIYQINNFIYSLNLKFLKPRSPNLVWRKIKYANLESGRKLVSARMSGFKRALGKYCSEIPRLGVLFLYIEFDDYSL